MREPQRLQRCCELQRTPDVAGFEAPHERGAQVIHLGFGLLETLLMVGARRRVEQGGNCVVVVAVTRPDGVGLAGLRQFLQGVLAHRFE